MSSTAAAAAPTPPRTTTSHRLSGGLLVSGPPEKPKPRPVTSSSAAPYTGGDVKLSSDLGKMFDLTSSTGTEPVRSPRPPPPKKSSSSSSSFSGPLVPATGLITSAPSSASSSTRRSGSQQQLLQHQLQKPPERKKTAGAAHGGAVTVVGPGREYGFAVSTPAALAVLLGLVLTLTLGVFLLIAVKSLVALGLALAMLAAAAGLAGWNCLGRDGALENFLREFPDTDLYGARDHQFVKVTGVVTCGSIPLETSYQGVPRCIFVSTELYEYRGLNGKQANPNHRRLTWGLRYSEKHVADFYISDSRRGVRALVKAGHGTKVVAFVRPANKLSISKKNKEMHPMFSGWLEDSNLSFDDRMMHLEEGYIKEGMSITVMGILRRHDNILMIVPPDKPVATGFIWRKFLLPIHIKGLILIGDENPNDEVVTV